MKDTFYKMYRVLTELVFLKDQAAKLSAEEYQRRKSVAWAEAREVLTFTVEEEAIEKMAEALWRKDYPSGGSRYKIYSETPYIDKQLYREEARKMFECFEQVVLGV